MSDLERQIATSNLLTSFSTPRSRRAFLAGTAATGLALVGTTLFDATGVSADTAASIKAIFTVARTAEQLAVTFYSNGLKHASDLGLVREDRENLHAALVEEQIHQIFFTAQGGDSLADTFSFPQGADTFMDTEKFINTQQQLEGVFDSAFIAAVREFAELGQPRLAQIASQIACVESEHRALGRAILSLRPADNWTYAPALLRYVADAPGLVQQSGYLSPKPGNTFKYQPVDTNAPNILYKDGPFTARP